MTFEHINTKNPNLYKRNGYLSRAKSVRVGVRAKTKTEVAIVLHLENAELEYEQIVFCPNEYNGFVAKFHEDFIYRNSKMGFENLAIIRQAMSEAGILVGRDNRVTYELLVENYL